MTGEIYSNVGPGASFGGGQTAESLLGRRLTKRNLLYSAPPQAHVSLVDQHVRQLDALCRLGRVKRDGLLV